MFEGLLRGLSDGSIRRETIEATGDGTRWSIIFYPPEGLTATEGLLSCARNLGFVITADTKSNL